MNAHGIYAMLPEEDHGHSPGEIEERLQNPSDGGYLKEWVYGGIDGVVTTFAIVAGVVGASLSPAIVLILGVANLVGDGFSMAAGCYSGTKTDIDNYERLRKTEHRHIEKFPEGEREEVRQIFAAKGFDGEDLEKIVDTIASDRDRWIDVMMAEEYGMSPQQRSPVKAALHTFVAFLVCGAAPLLPFAFDLPRAFALSLAMAAATFFAIGAFKSLWSVHGWLRHGLESMAVGLLAAGIAFAIGYGLRSLAV